MDFISKIEDNRITYYSCLGNQRRLREYNLTRLNSQSLSENAYIYVNSLVLLHRLIRHDHFCELSDDCILLSEGALNNVFHRYHANQYTSIFLAY